jgi:hypothetical protein
LIIICRLYGYSAGSEREDFAIIRPMAAKPDIKATIRIRDDAKIILIPEPATVLLLGLGAVVLRMRKSDT